MHLEHLAREKDHPGWDRKWRQRRRASVGKGLALVAPSARQGGDAPIRAHWACAPPRQPWGVDQDGDGTAAGWEPRAQEDTRDQY